MTIKLLYDRSKAFKKTAAKIRGLEQSIRDVSLRGALADMVLKMLYKRVKAGYGVDSDSSPSKQTYKVRLEPLSSAYKKRRKTMNLGEGATVNKSNLTATNQMLSAMRKSLKGFGFSVYIAATKRRGSKLTNAQVAKYVALQGRPFMRLTAGEARIVKSELKLRLKMKLRQLR